jgi:hypothetical protein
MGWACGTYGETRGAYRVLVGRPREGDHFEGLGADGRIILKCIFKKWVYGGMDWIDLAQYGDRWRTLVNAVMNLWVS